MRYLCEICGLAPTRSAERPLASPGSQAPSPWAAPVRCRRSQRGDPCEHKPAPVADAIQSGIRRRRALPTLTAFLSPQGMTIMAVAVATLIFLLALGALGAWLGGAKIVMPALRVGFWGATAMAVTAGIGVLVGKAI